MSSSDGTIGRIAVSRRPCCDGGDQDVLADAAFLVGRPDVDPPRAAARRRPGSTVSTDADAAQRAVGALDVGRRRQLEPDLDRGGPVAERGGQLLDRPDPDEPAGGEDADPVADRLDLAQQVARQHDRQTPLVDELAQQVEDLDHADRVDRRRRLVEDQQVR